MAKRKKTIAVIPKPIAAKTKALAAKHKREKVEFVLMATLDGLPTTCPGCNREGNFKRLEFGLWCPTCGTLALVNRLGEPHGQGGDVDCWLPRMVIDK